MNPRVIVIFLLLASPISAEAQTPFSPDAYQLQQLVATSKKQLAYAKELLQNGKQDSDYMEKSTRVLEKLSAGIGRSIEKYQGTAIYEKALLKLQAEDVSQGRFDQPEPDRRKSTQRFANFQSQTIKANQSDLETQKRLSEALRSAEQGFVPKIQTQTQLGSWQASTRVSSQLTELLSAIHGLHQDLNAKNQSVGGLAELLQGAEMQNQKQREVDNHGPR